MPNLTAKDIETGLRAIGQKARAAGEIIEIAIYGGAAVVLAFRFRNATRDVDAVVSGNPRSLRRYVREVAEEHRWDENWLNDAVKGFLSARGGDALRRYRSYPDERAPGLRVFAPTAEYLLAMKCMAMRIGAADASQDLADIRALMRETGYTDAASLTAVVEGFYPPRLITPRIAFGIEQIAAEYGTDGNGIPKTKKPRRGGTARRKGR